METFLSAKTLDSGFSIEYHHSSFKEVYEIYKGQEVEIYLEKHLSGPNGVGYIFRSSVFIGNCQDRLTYDDYFKAAYFKN